MCFGGLSSQAVILSRPAPSSTNGLLGSVTSPSNLQSEGKTGRVCFSSLLDSSFMNFFDFAMALIKMFLLLSFWLVSISKMIFPAGILLASLGFKATQLTHHWQLDVYSSIRYRHAWSPLTIQRQS